jgi:zinc protease
MDPTHAIVAILTPRPSGKAPALKPPQGPESFTPSHVKPVTLPAWAEQTVMQPALPQSNVRPTVSVLPNGLRLIVQPETVSHAVSVFGHIRNDQDLEAPPKQEGVARVLEGLFSYGTQALDRVAYQKALDEIGATESAGATFSLQVLSGQFERGVELLADNELRPALPPSAFKIVRDQEAGIVAGRMHSPGYLAERALDAALFPKGDPTLRQPTPASVSALTLDDVKAYYGRVFRPDLTTIVVIGDVSPTAARAAIEKSFGKWSASGPKPPTVLPPAPPNQAGLAAVPDASRIQDKVDLAETLDMNRFNPDYYALQLGNHVLGGAFYATRLYRDLRETTGLVYTVSSQLNATRTRAIYTVSFGCDPANVSRAAAVVRQDLEGMRSAPAGARELRQAKTLLLDDIPLAESSEDNIAAGLLARSDEGLPLDEPVRAAHRYLSLTAADVRAAFARWVRPDALVQVTQGPAPR